MCAWSLNGQAAFWSQLERGDSVLLTHAQVEAVVARVLETRPREQIEAVLAEMREQNRAGTLGDDAAFAGRRSEAATSPSAAKKDSSLNAAATRAASPMSVHSRAGSRQGGRPPNRPPEPARASAGSLGGTQQRGAARNPSPLNGEQGTGDVSGDVAAPVALDRLLCFLVTKSSQLQEKDEELVHTVLDRFMEGDAPGITREGFHQAVKQLDLPVRMRPLYPLEKKVTQFLYADSQWSLLLCRNFVWVNGIAKSLKTVALGWDTYATAQKVLRPDYLYGVKGRLAKARAYRLKGPSKDHLFYVRF